MYTDKSKALENARVKLATARLAINYVLRSRAMRKQAATPGMSNAQNYGFGPTLPSNGVMTPGGYNLNKPNNPPKPATPARPLPPDAGRNYGPSAFQTGIVNRGRELADEARQREQTQQIVGKVQPPASPSMQWESPEPLYSSGPRPDIYGAQQAPRPNTTASYPPPPWDSNIPVYRSSR